VNVNFPPYFVQAAQAVYQYKVRNKWKKLVQKIDSIRYWRRLGELLLEHSEEYSRLNWARCDQPSAVSRVTNRATRVVGFVRGLATRVRSYTEVRRPTPEDIAAATTVTPDPPAQDPEQSSTLNRFGGLASQGIEAFERVRTIYEVALVLFQLIRQGLWEIFVFFNAYAYVPVYAAGAFYVWNYNTTSGEQPRLEQGSEAPTPTSAPGDPPTASSLQ
jgi:hypothetical protein